MSKQKLTSIKDSQAIVSYDMWETRTYILIETFNGKNGIGVRVKRDLTIDHIDDLLKKLVIDFSSKHVTGYCNPGAEFRKNFKRIPKQVRYRDICY
ncbi:MAG: hypothetical protein LAT57_00200 [Balneolales bacterium]|nr:hypothetical protein [Balneolales bacterium]